MWLKNIKGENAVDDKPNCENTKQLISIVTNKNKVLYKHWQLRHSTSLVVIQKK